MKVIVLVVLFFLITTCSMQQKHSGTVEFVFNVESVKAYFEAKCAKDYPTATEAQLESCVEISVGEFLDAIKELAKPST